MADLHALIRLRKYDLEALQKVLAGLNNRAISFERQIEALKEEFTREKELAAGSMTDFSAYTRGVREKEKALNRELSRINQEIEKQRDRIADAYRALKAVEMTQERRDQARAEKINKKQADELDSVGLEIHRRHAQDEAE